MTTFSYDAAGDLKSDGPNTYTHSARGRLSAVTLAAGTVNYLYNGLEQRLVKTSTNTSLVPGGARYYMYDEQGHTIGEYDQDGNPVYEVAYLGDAPVAVITQNRTVTNGVLSVQTKVSYVYADHLDTPRVIVRASDHFIQWRWDQAEAYGTSPPNENPNALGQFSFNLRFPGQLFDQESNLVYNHHRYFDASTGRYVESDPIGLDGGSNTYVYVYGQPLAYADPLGLFAGDGHSNMTRSALDGETCIDVEKLARQTQDADYVKGSQAPENSHWHAMSNGKAGESAESAQKRYEEFVEESLAQCTLGALAKALHAVQDSAAAGHRGFQAWNGGLPSRKHAKADFFPSKESWNEGIEKTKELVNRYKEKCGCCKLPGVF